MTPETGSAISRNLRFPGQYWDADTQLHQNYFRDYSPSLGRYVQSDPIGLKGGVNLWAYSNQSSLSFADWSGSYATKPGVPDIPTHNPDLHIMLVCIEDCYGFFTVTATTNGSHSKGSAHAEGLAFDITVEGNTNGALCCGFKCGVVYAQDEYTYPSSKSTGGHLHMQTRPGKGGAVVTGSKPRPKNCECYPDSKCCGVS